MYNFSNKVFKCFYGMWALVFWVFCLLPLPGFSDQEFTLADFEGSIDASSYEQKRKEISFVTTVPIHVHCRYPLCPVKRVR